MSLHIRISILLATFSFSTAYARLPTCSDELRRLLETSKAHARVSLFLAGQIGIHQVGQLKRSIAQVRQVNLTGLKNFSDQPTLGKPDVQAFLRRNQLKAQKNDGFVFVPKDTIGRYVNEVAQGTVEVLYVPTARVDPLPKSVNQVGHLALRIGDKVYNQTGTRGFVIEDFSKFITETKKDFRVYGYVLSSSPKEQELMRRYFQRVAEKQIPYSFLMNNCSEVVCRGLEVANLHTVSKTRRLDPYLVKRQVAKHDRVLMRAYYNNDSISETMKTGRAAGNRAFFYGVPALAVGGVAYSTYEAGKLLSEYLDLFSETDLTPAVIDEE